MTQADSQHGDAQGHGHVHGQDQTPEDVEKLFTVEAWDERYRGSDRVWSGNVNQRLVEQASDLPPGTALDIGSGEGGDAIWLARRGWQVTAVDISQVALDRSAGIAAEASPEAAGRITWRQADLMAEPAQFGSFDLVCAHFMHLPGPAREALYRQLAESVNPGGSLLLVGHHPSDLSVRHGHWNVPGMWFTAEDLVAALPADDWDIKVATSAPREATIDGEVVTLHDAVLHAVRRPV